MKKPEIDPNTISSYEANKKIRKDWGNINPVTRVEISKKHKKPKHLKNEIKKLMEE